MTRLGLTQRQHDVLAFIRQRMAETGGIAPTYAEIGAGVGLTAKGNLARIIQNLKDRGWLSTRPGAARSIGLTKERNAVVAPVLADATTAELVAELSRRFPGVRERIDAPE